MKSELSKCFKFLGVLLDKNLCWKRHIKYIESKIAKNIALLYKAKPYIDKHSLLSLNHSHIHSYLNYGNIAWGSTTRINHKKYIVNRNMLSEECIVKIDCHTLENSLRGVKFLLYIK